MEVCDRELRSLIVLINIQESATSHRVSVCYRQIRTRTRGFEVTLSSKTFISTTAHHLQALVCRH